jgi:hypothetical protein
LIASILGSRDAENRATIPKTNLRRSTMNRAFAILIFAFAFAIVGCKSTTTTATDDAPTDTLPVTDVEDTAIPAMELTPAMEIDAPEVSVAAEVPIVEDLDVPSAEVMTVTDPDVEAVIPDVSSEIANAATLFVGELTASRSGPMGLSNPPLYNVTLTLDVTESFRGDFAADESATISYQVRQQNPPVFTAGESYIVTGHYDPRVERFIGESATLATEEALSSARLAGTLPVGWSASEGKLIAPWSAELPWPGRTNAARMLVDSVTGRRALLVPEGISLTTAKVPPAEEIKWTNPDGDGLYTVTVTNTTDAAIRIPALLSDGDGNILWANSLIVLSKDTSETYAHPAPGATLMEAEPQATTLQPGESVSGVVNTLLLPGIKWPRGGYRVEFTFCLGQLASMQSFYYKSSHHDPIREGAINDPAPDTDTPTTTE